MGAVYLMLLLKGVILSTILLFYLLSITCTNIGFAAIGYWINDFFDRKKDSRSNKPNIFNNTSSSNVSLFIVGTISFALVPWIWLPSSKFVFYLLALEMLLFIMYAAPPLRLKERGWLGVFVDSIYASVLPAFILLLTIRQAIGEIEEITLWEIALYLLLFISGLRKILIHQIEDIDADNLSATPTLAVRYGAKRTNTIVTHVILPLEIFSFVLLVVALFQVSAWLSVILTGLFLLRLLFSPLGENILKYHPESSRFLNKILNGPQEVDLPLVVLGLLCMQDGWYFFILFFHVIIFLPGHRQVLNAGKDYIAKPVYYHFIPEVYYTVKRTLPVIYYMLVSKYYSVFRFLDKSYSVVKKGCVYLYHDVFLLFYYKVIVWSYYNIVLKSLVSIWKAGFFLLNGKSHKPDEKNNTARRQ